MEKIYKKEKIKIPIEIDLSSITKILESFRTKLLIIEVEGPNYTQFALGKIEEINGENVKIRHMDGEGKILKNAVQIKLEDITMIQSGNRYLKMYNKYWFPN
jgi:hypothetical protein